MTEREIIKRKIVIKQQLVEITLAEIKELERKLGELTGNDNDTPSCRG